MARKSPAAQLVQQALDFSAKPAPPTPTGPKAIKELDNQLRRLQTRYSLATDPAEKALIKTEFDAVAVLHRDAKVATRKAKDDRAKRDPSFVTGTNLSALVDYVIENNGTQFPRRVPASHAPHLKRCVMAGLLEEHSGVMRLTAEGKQRVADKLVARIDRETKYQPRENIFVTDPERRAAILADDRAKHQARKDRLERILATIIR